MPRFWLGRQSVYACFSDEVRSRASQKDDRTLACADDIKIKSTNRNIARNRARLAIFRHSDVHVPDGQEEIADVTVGCPIWITNAPSRGWTGMAGLLQPCLS